MNNRQKMSAVVCGHFSSLWVPFGHAPTTVTNQRKSRAKEKEATKKAQLLKELEVLTGSPVSAYSRKIDSVNRRWQGVRGSGSDG